MASSPVPFLTLEKHLQQNPTCFVIAPTHGIKIRDGLFAEIHYLTGMREREKKHGLKLQKEISFMFKPNSNATNKTMKKKKKKKKKK